MYTFYFCLFLTVILPMHMSFLRFLITHDRVAFILYLIDMSGQLIYGTHLKKTNVRLTDVIYRVI